MSLEHSHQNQIHNLQRLGLSRNESLVYLCLLESESAEGLSGYEVAARSDVPRSAVYAILNALTEWGAVNVQGKPQRFFAISPAQWLEAQQQTHKQLLSELLPSLENVATLVAPEPIWMIRRHREVIDQMQMLISNATSFIGLSLLPADLKQLVLPTTPTFPIVIHSPSPYEGVLPGSCWIEQEPIPPRFNRLLLVDGQEVLQGHFSQKASNEMVRTRNPSFYDTALCAFEQRIVHAASQLAISAASDCKLLHAQKADLWKD